MGPHRRFCQGMLCALALALPATGRAAEADDVATLAARIDKSIDARLADEKVPAAPIAGDAEYLRRVYLDLTGRIPSVAEAHRFLDDRNPDKRRILVEELLRSPHHLTHFTNIWRSEMLAAANTQQAQFLAGQLEPWIRRQMRENVPYDRMVRELLTTPLTGQGGRIPTGGTTAVAFFQANEMKPENLAASTAKLFLGVQLQCAQCHNHPFATWKREQFWEYAAFFSGIKPQNVNAGVFSPATDTPDKRDLKIPDSEKTVQAKYLDGKEPQWQADVPTRGTLAVWMTAADNPYFAKARVNRMWAHFFGLGLVEPVDDLTEDNHPSHPELLDELSRAFVKQGFDQRFVIRAILASKSYQRTSIVTDESQADSPRLFPRMALKGMTAEMLFESVAKATGFVPPVPGDDPREFNDFQQGRQEFLARFATVSEKRTEHQTTILQALSLMNGRVIEKTTHLERSRTLAAVVDGPFKDDRERLDTLFLATLSRRMTTEEAQRLTKYVGDGGPTGDRKKALADVFWVLLNSTEFALNH